MYSHPLTHALAPTLHHTHTHTDIKMMTLRAIAAVCLLTCLATATAPTTRHALPKLVQQRVTHDMQSIPWTTTASTAESSLTAPLTKSLPKDNLPTTPTTTDGARVASASGSTNDMLSKVRPGYRRYGPTVLVHTATPASSAAPKTDSNVEIKPPLNTTSAPASSTTTPPAPIWQTTANMTCAASGGWNTGPWGTLVSPSSDNDDLPASGVASTPLLGKYSVVDKFGWCSTLMWLAEWFAKILVWLMMSYLIVLGHCSKGKIVEVEKEEIAPAEDDDAAEYENVIGGPDVELLLRETSPTKGVAAFLAYMSGKKSTRERRHTIVTEGNACEIHDVWKQVNAQPRRLSAPAVLVSLVHIPPLQHLRRGSATDEDRVRSESNQPRLAQSTSLNVDATTAAAATAALMTAKVGEDTAASLDPTLPTPADEARLDAVLANAVTAGAAKVAADAEVHEVVEDSAARAEEENAMPVTKKNKVKAACTAFFEPLMTCFGRSKKQQEVEPALIFADQEAKSHPCSINTPQVTITRTPTISTTDVNAFRYNPYALANRKAALRAAASSIVPPTFDAFTSAADLLAAAAAAPARRVLQITCDYDDDEPAVAPAAGDKFFPTPPPPVLTRQLDWLNVSQSGSGGIFSCENVPATPPAMSTVVPVEGETEGGVVAAPAIVPVPAPAAPSHPRGLSGMVFDMLDKSGSSGGMIASSGVIEMWSGSVEEGREGGVVAPAVVPTPPPTTHKCKFSLVDFLSLSASGGRSFPSFGVVETVILPVEGPKEEEVVVAPVEEEEEEEEEEKEEEEEEVEVEHEMPTF